MLIQTSKEEINRYYENSAMNQSLLKKLMKGPAAFIAAQQEPEQKLYYEEKGHFIIGKAVDCFITEGQEEFEKLYFTTKAGNKPSPKIMSIIKYAFDRLIEQYNTIQDELVFETPQWNILLHNSCTINEYFLNRAKPIWEEDGRLQTIKKDTNYITYLKSLLDAQGKQILSEDESNIVSGIIMSLTTHPYIKDYFNPINENVDIIMQLPIYFTYKWDEKIEVYDEELGEIEKDEEHEEDCKGLLDVCIIDHNAKTIQPIDIKTGAGEPFWFISQLNQFDYQIQAKYYSLALEQWKNKILLGQYESLLKDYTILPFKFIVESTNIALQGNPLVFVCTEQLLDLGLNGRPEMIVRLENDLFNDYIVYHEIKGIKQLFSDYVYYKENGFNKRREIKEGNHFNLDYHGAIPIEFVRNNNLNTDNY